MVVSEGPDGEVFLPSLYANTHRSDDAQLRLGRGTQWIDEEGTPVRGFGQRMFLVGDEAKTILQLKEITFQQADST